MPFSMSSTSIRFALSLRAFARLRTWAATFAGKLTLCRTALIRRSHNTIMHQTGATGVWGTDFGGFVACRRIAPHN